MLLKSYVYQLSLHDDMIHLCIIILIANLIYVTFSEELIQDKCSLDG